MLYFETGGTCCCMNCNVLHLVDNNLGFQMNSSREIGYLQFSLYDSRGHVVLRSHPQWTGLSLEVSTEEGGVWMKGDGVTSTSL